MLFNGIFCTTFQLSPLVLIDRWQKLLFQPEVGTQILLKQCNVYIKETVTTLFVRKAVMGLHK